MKICIAVRAVDVHVGSSRILEGIDLTVEQGRVVGLLGPSGAGKTTLLRSLLGLQKIHRGRIEIFGKAVGQPSLRSEIGYMSQVKGVYPDLSVLDNLRYFGSLMGSDRQQIEIMLEKMELSAQAKQRVSQLSGGQATRVSLAIALLGRPKLLLLDEPTVGLDPVLRQKLWLLFRQLADEGVTLIVSSHVMDEAERCDDIVFLRQGRVLIGDHRQAVMKATKTSSMEEAFLRLSQEVSHA